MDDGVVRDKDIAEWKRRNDRKRFQNPPRVEKPNPKLVGIQDRHGKIHILGYMDDGPVPKQFQQRPVCQITPEIQYCRSVLYFTF